LVEKLAEEENTQQSLDGKIRQALQLWFETVEPLLREQKCADTIKLCRDIIELWPPFPEPYFALGVCYSQSGQSAQAEASFEKYLSLKPNSADGHAAFGLSLLQQGRNEEAGKHLESAITIDPGLLEARKALASIYLIGENSPAAIRVLQSEGKSRELDNEARLLLAEALLHNRESALALQEVNRVLKKDPANQAATRLRQEILSLSQ
jgi:tetratricopeptide (TPR) repeat protein